MADAGATPTGYDCATIESHILYYQAAINYDSAQINVARNQLTVDQAAYYSWLMLKYQYCQSTPPVRAQGVTGNGGQADAVKQPYPITLEMMQDLLQKITLMHTQYKDLVKAGPTR